MIRKCDNLNKQKYCRGNMQCPDISKYRQPGALCDHPEALLQGRPSATKQGEEVSMWGLYGAEDNYYYYYYFLCQMAVSQNTVFCVGYGGGLILLVPLLFPQLARTDTLSCLHWLRSRCLSSFLSGGGGFSRYRCKCRCCLERISAQRLRFLSICSSIVVSPHIHGIWSIWVTKVMLFTETPGYSSEGTLQTDTSDMQLHRIYCSPISNQINSIHCNTPNHIFTSGSNSTL